MDSYPTDDAGLIITHGQNMESAGICRDRHNALVKYLKEQKAKENE